MRLHRLESEEALLYLRVSDPKQMDTDAGYDPEGIPSRLSGASAKPKLTTWERWSGANMLNQAAQPLVSISTRSFNR